MTAFPIDEFQTLIDRLNTGNSPSALCFLSSLFQTLIDRLNTQAAAEGKQEYPPFQTLIDRLNTISFFT